MQISKNRCQLFKKLFDFINYKYIMIEFEFEMYIIFSRINTKRQKKEENFKIKNQNYELGLN